MSVSLTNTKDITDTTISIITGNKLVKIKDLVGNNNNGNVHFDTADLLLKIDKQTKRLI